MNTKDCEIIFEKAIKKWGNEFQLKMVAEECAELIQAVLKFDRKVNGSSIQQVIDEMADVYIMLGQLEIILKGYCNIDINKEIHHQFQKKMMRLKDLVESGGEVPTGGSVNAVCRESPNAPVSGVSGATPHGTPKPEKVKA